MKTQISRRAFSLVVAFTFSALSPQMVVAQTSVSANAWVELSDAEQRKLAFFADKMIGELKTIAADEDRGDTSAASRHLGALQSSSRRFTATAEKAGLSPESTVEYFQIYFFSTYEGRLPSVLTSSSGDTDFEGLLFSAPPASTANTAPSADYVGTLLLEGANR